MKMSQQKEDTMVRVIKYTLPSGQQVSLLTTDKRLLCCQPQPDSPWEPIELENMGLVAAISRL